MINPASPSFKAFTHRAVAGRHGRAYEVTAGGVEGVITLINCDPADEQALLADAVDQFLRLQSLKIGGKP